MTRALRPLLLLAALGCGTEPGLAPEVSLEDIRVRASPDERASISELELPLGSPETVYVELLFSDGSRRPGAAAVSWTSTDWRVVDPDGSGTLIPGRIGDAVVSLSRDGVRRELRVRVRGALGVGPRPFRLDPAALVLYDRESVTLTPLEIATGLPASLQSPVWESSNPAVAQVDSNGRVAAQEPGQALISALDAATGERASATVAVSAGSVEGATLESPTLELVRGETIQIRALGPRALGEEPEDLTATLRWLSLDPEVVTVSNEAGSAGRVTAVAPGVVSVEARTFAGALAGRVTLRVVELEIESLELPTTSLEIFPGQRASLLVIARFNDGTTRNIAPELDWQVNDPTVADIVQGVVEARDFGATSASYTDPRDGTPQSISVRVAQLARVELAGDTRSLSEAGIDRYGAAWLSAAAHPMRDATRVVIAWNFDPDLGHHRNELIFELVGEGTLFAAGLGSLAVDALVDDETYFAGRRGSATLGGGEVRLAASAQGASALVGTFEVAVCPAEVSGCAAPLSVSGDFALGVQAPLGTIDNPFPIRVDTMSHRWQSGSTYYVARTEPDTRWMIQADAADVGFVVTEAATGAPIDCDADPDRVLPHCIFEGNGDEVSIAIELPTASLDPRALVYGMAPTERSITLSTPIPVQMTAARFEAPTPSSVLTLNATANASLSVTIEDIDVGFGFVTLNEAGVVNGFCTATIGEATPTFVIPCVTSSAEQRMNLALTPRGVPYFFGESIRVTVDPN